MLSGRPGARRIEHRFAGAEANPYLVMAAVLAGVHWGLTRKLKPTPPSSGNAGAEFDPDMPNRLWPALDRIEKAEILAEYLGPPIRPPMRRSRAPNAMPSSPRCCPANTIGICMHDSFGWTRPFRRAAAAIAPSSPRPSQNIARP
jgi:hypothetical protein